MTQGGQNQMMPRQPAQFTGHVVRRTIGKGTKSEYEAMVLDTGKGGRFTLIRAGGNPFSDPALKALEGKRITCTAVPHLGRLYVQSWTVLPEERINPLPSGETRLRIAAAADAIDFVSERPPLVYDLSVELTAEIARRMFDDPNGTGVESFARWWASAEDKGKLDANGIIHFTDWRSPDWGDLDIEVSLATAPDAVLRFPARSGEMLAFLVWKRTAGIVTLVVSGYGTAQQRAVRAPYLLAATTRLDGACRELLVAITRDLQHQGPESGGIAA